MSKKDSLYPQSVFQEEVPGVSVPWKWAGRSQAGNRRSIPPNYFWTIDNVRLEDDDVVGRKGLAKVNSADSSDTSCILGITDLPAFPTSGRIFLSMGDSDGYVQAYIPALDTDATIDLNPDITNSVPLALFRLIKYNDNLYTDNGKVMSLREAAGTLQASIGEFKIYPLTDSGSQMVVAPTEDTDPDRAGELNLWTIADSSVYRWDGNQSFLMGELSADFSNISPELLGYFHEQIVVVASGQAEGTTGLWYRDFDGAWNAVALPTIANPGGTAEFVAQGITNYKDELLIHGYSTGSGASGIWYGTILVWDGTSLTVGTQTDRVGSSEVTPTGIFDATVYNGNYYYPYAVDSVFAPYIGRYNGTTFSDTQIDGTTFLSTGYAPGGISSIGGTLFVSSYDWSGETGTNQMFITTDLSTWTSITMTNAKLIDFPHRAFTL